MKRREDATVVVVGGGQGGCEVVSALRNGGHEGPITLISAEQEPPYSRPALSKSFLLADAADDELHLRPGSFYADQRVDLRLGSTVDRIDRERRLVHTADGQSFSFDALVLATGGTPRRLNGAPRTQNIRYVRTFADARRLKIALSARSKVAVIGAGYIGLEVAAAARQLGAAVTLIHRGPALLQHTTSRPVSEFFARLHREEGVDVHLDAQPSDFGVSAGRLTELTLSDGAVLDVDALVVGVGIAPQDHLAAEAGLDVADGVLVDEDCRTSDAHVYAIGDCARYPCDVTGATRRLESVPNASAHARTVAAAILGHPRPASTVPWFWSDQYDVKLQVAGLSASADELIVRGESTRGRSFSVAYLRDGRLIALDAVNQARDFAAAKRLIQTSARMDPRRVADPSLPLKDAVAEAAHAA
jgi:3-phenylpropionate/trans-cinnamate dioxygenase ferredoxin reductase subunit